MKTESAKSYTTEDEFDAHLEELGRLDREAEWLFRILVVGYLLIAVGVLVQVIRG